MTKYVAEFIGTFGLTFAVLMSLNNPDFGVPTAVVAALTLGLFVYSIGRYSGTHINPAVTLGLWSVKKIETNNALMYIVSQFVGAFFAMVLTSLLIARPEFANSVAPSAVGFDGMNLAGELLGAFIFTFGIASVVNDTKGGRASAMFTVGGSLLLGLLFASNMSAGILNPAVALGIKSFDLSYLIGPIIGSVLGFNVYHFLNTMEDEESSKVSNEETPMVEVEKEIA